MVRAAGPAAGLTMPQVATVAVVAIGMFVAVMLLVLGMSQRGTRAVPGHRIRARTRHNRPGPRSGEYGGAESPSVRGGLRGGRPPGLALWRDAPDDPRGWQ